MNLGDKIKAIARFKGVSTKELCQKIGMSESGFYTAIQKNRFKSDTLEKIASTLEIPMNELVSYDPITFNLEHLAKLKSTPPLNFNEKFERYKFLTKRIEELKYELGKLEYERDLIFDTL